ncbi:hypothetical protein FCL47_23175 [Desulfopila sp. IMCC35006]|uniref:hypothetical protein n=1 Tax=Desulfopila sp. IMCC35006 TaxID=2569542 RepID=UPI0010ACA079|nr:hypothetical protein [Desulfopila sp. IMCC35006]TKB23263.1 hypothetical protein FCL47_23175 [Desulfopila sp. IMCC35006]
MQDITSEDLFDRICSYLRLSGVPLQRDSILVALELVKEILAGDTTDVLDRIIIELPQRLQIPELSLPLLCPLVNRGSIGYQDE